MSPAISTRSHLKAGLYPCSTKQSLISHTSKQTRRKRFLVASRSSRTSCSPFGSAEMTMSAAFEPCVTSIYFQLLRERVTISQLLVALKETQEKWASVKFTGTYADVKEHAAKFATYKQTTKRAWVTEKQDLATLLGNVQTKLKTYKLRPYLPPPGLALSVCIICETSRIQGLCFNRTSMKRGRSS
jgi:hypothetical protein